MSERGVGTWLGFGAALLFGLAGGAAHGDGMVERKEPYAGYLYPAGARKGSTVRVTAGGRTLGGVASAHLSGDGVRASIVRYMRPLNARERQELQRRLAELGNKRRGGKGAEGKPEAPKERVELPDYPLLDELDKLTPAQIQEVVSRYLGFGGKRQQNAQLAETVEIELEIAPDAAPGPRELRFATPAGLSNPLRFDVGTLPEVNEPETFEAGSASTPLLDLPVVVNGQILPGDVDRIRFRAHRGDRLVIGALARGLVPFLADAVPGWFQAKLSLRDGKGREVAYDDGYRFDPDPVLFYEVPADGEYVVEIWDALWRGREDFVYRVAIGERPFITRMFPLGGREGFAKDASVFGWNLGDGVVPLDTRPGEGGVRFTEEKHLGQPSNRVPYAVDALPETDEAEPNDDAAHAQALVPPVVVNGRIGRAGDADCFLVEGREGEEIVAEVDARRLGSPVDSLLRLIDGAGRVISWNDDFEDGEAGVLTHHADSYLRARLPADGFYTVRLTDAQGHGGPEYAYRLRLGAPRPDFALSTASASLSVLNGRAAPLLVQAARRDGFDGEIALVLKDAPAGWMLDGGRIPAGRSSIRVTLCAPANAGEAPFELHIEGRATIAGETVRRAAVAAEDRMQAFAYRHLVPAQELLATVTGNRRDAAPPELATAAPVKIPLGGVVFVEFRVPALRGRPDLDEPPAGLVIEDWALTPGGLTIALRATAGVAKAGTTDNLIIEVLSSPGGKRPDAKVPRERLISVGYLPAVPVEVTAK